MATVTLVVGTLIVSACGSSESTSPLPTSACLSVPIGIGIIHGDPATPDRIILNKDFGDTDTLVDEANSYDVVFDPNLRIVHVDGREVASEGDEVEIGGYREDGPPPPVPGAIKWCGDLRLISEALDHPTPTQTPATPSPTLFATPAGNRPSTDGTALGDSNAFWYGTIAFGPETPSYTHLAEAVNDAHLIVVGHIVEVRDLATTDPAPGVPSFYARIAEDEVLFGQAESLYPGWFDVRLLRGLETSIEDLRQLMPDHQTLFFLRSAEISALENGHSPAYAEQWRYKYGVSGPGGIIRDIDGDARVHQFWLEYAPNFPNEYEGAAFEDVVQIVRDEIALRNQ